MIEITSTDIKDGCDTLVFLKTGFIKWIIETDGGCEFTFKDGYSTFAMEAFDDVKIKLAADSYGGKWQENWIELLLEENGKQYRMLLNKYLISLIYRDEDLTKVETYIEGAMKCPVFHALNSYKDVKAQMEETYASARKKKNHV